MTPQLTAPFPWPGGKRRAAGEVWRRLGTLSRYVEPFAGGLAVLLARPEPSGVEIINDADGHVVNFWRAVRSDPSAVADWCAGPMSAVDLCARSSALSEARDRLVERLCADPDYCDLRLAGWWVWCVSQAIGKPLLSGSLVKPHLACERGIFSTAQPYGSVAARLDALSRRLSRVHLACGDFEALLTPSVIDNSGTVGVFLDPPYQGSESVYQHAEPVALRAYREALRLAESAHVRVAYCCYEGQFDFPPGWSVFRWSSGGGPGSSSRVEEVWFSPSCHDSSQLLLPL